MMPFEKKGLGINPYSQPHYLDHLAVVCMMLQVPLLVIDEMEAVLAEKCYPGLDILRIDFQDFNPEFLISNFDYIVSSDLWGRQTLREKFAVFEKEYKKILRCVHCPHGFSDKGYYLRKSADEDILLAYGEHFLDLLKREGVFARLNEVVLTGNYRALYYHQNKASLDKLIEQEVLSQFESKKKTILYAPTWLDIEKSTSYFEAAAILFDNLPDEYNMIVKLHPRLELDDTAHYYQLLGKYEGKKNLAFVKDLPLIYPLLSCSDIYIGDTSAVGYDYLYFDRPMYFLNSRKKDYPIFRCGEVLEDSFEQIFNRIAKNVEVEDSKYKAARKELYTYTFGQEMAFDKVREEIFKKLS